MTDTLSGPARSALMARVRQKDTAPEMVVRRALHGAGLRYRLHPKHLPGRPDLVFPRHRTAVFVHGCYWHGHSCRAGRAPSSNVAYWIGKLADNRARDARKQSELEALGWRVLTVWECEVKGASANRRMTRLSSQIRGRSRKSESARLQTRQPDGRCP